MAVLLAYLRILIPHAQCSKSDNLSWLRCCYDGGRAGHPPASMHGGAHGDIVAAVPLHTAAVQQLLQVRNFRKVPLDAAAATILAVPQQLRVSWLREYTLQTVITQNAGGAARTRALSEVA